MPRIVDQLRPYMEQFASQGVSANEALRRCIAAGMGARRTDFLKIYKEYTGVIEKQPAWKAIRKDYFATKRLYTESIKRMLNNFTYKAEIRFLNTRTQAIGKMTTSIGSDIVRRISEIEDEAFKIFEGANVEKYMQLLSIVTVGGLVSVGYEW